MDFSSEYKKYQEIKVDIEFLKEKKQRKKGELIEANKTLYEFNRKLEKEKLDVDQLETLSLTQIFFKLSGKFEEKKKKEYLEYIEAKQKYDEESYVIEKLEEEILILESEVRKKENLLIQQETYLVSNFEEAKKINETLERERENHLRIKKEYVEAFYAVGHVLSVAKKMKDYLDSAEAFAVYDTFWNGGIIADMEKYSQIEEAQKIQIELRHTVNNMKKELRDVDIEFQDISLSIDSITKVFDVIFDDLYTNWKVKNQIKKNNFKLQEYIDRLIVLQELLIKRREKEEEAIESCHF